MNLNELYQYCLGKPGAIETFPFGDDVSVIKVGSKIFAMIGILGEQTRITLKCDPLRAEDYRRQYPAVIPGYYMNKRHWNTIEIDGSIPDTEIQAMIDHSYHLVVLSLPKNERPILG